MFISKVLTNKAVSETHYSKKFKLVQNFVKIDNRYAKIEDFANCIIYHSSFVVNPTYLRQLFL